MPMYINGHRFPTTYCEHWLEDLVEIHREKVQETMAISSFHSVVGMVGIAPGIAPLSEGLVQQHVKNSLCDYWRRERGRESW